MDGDPRLVVALDSSVPLRSRDDVVWRLTVSNRSEESIELTFPTGQLGDVRLERAGAERYRWSAGLVFVQVLSERLLERGAAWTVTLDGVLDVEPGAYDAVGVLTCRPAPPPVRVAVAVEAADGSGAVPAR